MPVSSHLMLMILQQPMHEEKWQWKPQNTATEDASWVKFDIIWKCPLTVRCWRTFEVSGISVACLYNSSLMVYMFGFNRPSTTTATAMMKTTTRLSKNNSTLSIHNTTLSWMSLSVWKSCLYNISLSITWWPWWLEGVSMSDYFAWKLVRSLLKCHYHKSSFQVNHVPTN